MCVFSKVHRHLIEGGRAPWHGSWVDGGSWAERSCYQAALVVEHPAQSQVRRARVTQNADDGVAAERSQAPNRAATSNPACPRNWPSAS